MKFCIYKHFFTEAGEDWNLVCVEGEGATDAFARLMSTNGIAIRRQSIPAKKTEKAKQVLLESGWFQGYVSFENRESDERS